MKFKLTNTKTKDGWRVFNAEDGEVGDVIVIKNHNSYILKIDIIDKNTIRIYDLQNGLKVELF